MDNTKKEENWKEFIEVVCEAKEGLVFSFILPASSLILALQDQRTACQLSMNSWFFTLNSGWERSWGNDYKVSEGLYWLKEENINTYF